MGTTESNVTHKRLASSEEVLRGAFEYSTMPMGISDISNRFIRVNAALTELFGYSESEMLRMSMEEITHPDDIVESYTSREPLLAGAAHSFQIEKRYLHKDGRIIWCLVNISLVRDADGVPLYYVGQIQDITERKRAEDGLRLRDRAIDAFVQGVVITHPHLPDNPIVYVNQGFEQMTGYSASEALGRNCRFLQGPKTDPAVVATIRAAIREERRCLVELLNYRKDGTPFWNALSLAPIHDTAGRLTHFVGVQTDITPFKRLEEQLRQSQKMEAIGSLAGGVAHDFNNLLTIINGYSEIIQEQLPTGDPVKTLARNIFEAGQRASSLTRQLLAFSRKQVLEPKVLNLNTVVMDMAKMLKRLIGEDIDLVTALAPGLGRVKADPGQLEQVLVNLCVNARDAMPQGGKLTVETANIDLDETYTRAFPEVQPGPYVLLAVADTGIGMDEATKARVFEPFFTTKGEGKGTGLGLATVFGIVKQSGGHVTVYTEPGQGAAFKVYLPRIEERVATSMSSHHGFHQAPQGNETILLVEDEPALLALSRHILKALGYTVLEANGGEKALQLIEQYPGPIHIIVTDVVMPGISGRELAEQVTSLLPQTKVLFLSGYTDDAVVRHGVVQAETAFLQKPFTPSALAQKVREVLDTTREAT